MSCCHCIYCRRIGWITLMGIVFEISLWCSFERYTIAGSYIHAGRWAVIFAARTTAYLCLPLHQQSPCIRPQRQLNLHRSLYFPRGYKKLLQIILVCSIELARYLASPVSSSLDNKPDGVQKPLWQKSLGDTCCFWIPSSFAGKLPEFNYGAWISVSPRSICYSS